MCIVGLLILGLSVLSYFILKHYGFKKAGFAVSLILALIVILPVFAIVFESQLYFKRDARDDLGIVDIVLKDDFEIESNDIVGFPDYYQDTKLKISDNDRNTIIDKIKKNKNFEELSSEESQHTRVDNKNEITSFNYKIENEYVLEKYKKRPGYSTIQIRITVKPNSNNLLLSRIED
jgi:hypothetical protein